MTFLLGLESLAEFLVKAKIDTYASGTDEFVITPTLTDSRQLEYKQGELTYQDIYFGGLAFIGLETVYHNKTAVWGMSYYGTVLPGATESETASMPPFLKQALRKIPIQAPFRGPESLSDGSYRYLNSYEGDIQKFNGVEMISYGENPIYRLFYSGGIIR